MEFILLFYLCFCEGEGTGVRRVGWEALVVVIAFSLLVRISSDISLSNI